MTQSVAAMLADANAAVARISAAETKALIDSGDAVVIDVREPGEVAVTGKVPGALNIPRGLIEFKADQSGSLYDRRIDPEKTIILYCASGGRSALAGQALQALGYANVRNMGGFNDWDQENFPVEEAEG